MGTGCHCRSRNKLVDIGPVKVGLLSDTHGAYDPVAAECLRGVQLVLHAGDVGNHGGHEGVLQLYAKGTCAAILAVAGNVDDKLDAGGHQMLPDHRLVTIAGWKILLTHVVAPGPQAKVDTSAARLLQLHQPDIVVFGHSHKATSWCEGGVHYINPGSAGPARFKLPRSVATLLLPSKNPIATKCMISEGSKLSNDTSACSSGQVHTGLGCTVMHVAGKHSEEHQPQVHFHFLGNKCPRRS
eukprot:GHUV01028809.1.p1 GENE.GHUV01028809.1~~GHUV01028809.1.p1  ORF type:complete len:241 (+),score=38.16 GHUV01028809.1:738-1460(+)